MSWGSEMDGILQDMHHEQIHREAEMLILQNVEWKRLNLQQSRHGQTIQPFASFGMITFVFGSHQARDHSCFSTLRSVGGQLDQSTDSPSRDTLQEAARTI